MEISAILFDLDGVLCSTDRFHYRAWKELADRLGLPFNEEINRQLRGVTGWKASRSFCGAASESLPSRRRQHWLKKITAATGSF